MFLLVCISRVGRIVRVSGMWIMKWLLCLSLDWIWIWLFSLWMCDWIMFMLMLWLEMLVICCLVEKFGRNIRCRYFLLVRWVVVLGLISFFLWVLVCRCLGLILVLLFCILMLM